MARQKNIHTPYVIEKDKKKNQKKDLNNFQIAFLKAIENLEEHPKPTKWIKPIKEVFKPIEEQKDLGAARLAFTLNPRLRIKINNSLSKK